MKSGAISGGIRTGGVSAGMRVSGGTVRMGGLSSPEARFGGASSKFSSRGLSNFNRSPIGFKEIGGVRSSNSIVNINRGKEAKSKSARTPSLGRQRSMFDVSRPIQHSPVSMPSEFGVKVSLRNGREARPSKARTNSLLTPRPMFDMSRKPVNMGEFGKRMSVGKVDSVSRAKKVERPLINPFRNINRVASPRPEYRTVAQRTQEVGFNPRVRSERVKRVSPFTDTVILWQRKDVSPRVKLEAAVRHAPKKETIAHVKNLEHVTVTPRRVELGQPRKKEVVKGVPKARIETQTRRKTEKAKVPKRLKVGSIVRVSKDVSPEVRSLIYRDIKDAKVILIPAIMKARKVSYQEAAQEVTQTLAKKHEGKVHVDANLLAKLKLQNLEEQEEDVKPATVAKEKQKAPKKPVVTEEVLYFKKDTVTNERRQNRFIEAYHKLLKYRKPEEGSVTSYDVVREAGDTPKPEEISELTRDQKVDYRYYNLMYTVKLFSGILTDPKDFLAILGVQINRFSAIKLSSHREANAKGKDAMDVYGKALNKVGAYVGDLGEMGILTADTTTRRVTIRKGSSNQLQPGVEVRI